MKQSDYVIKYDKLNEIYTCNINSKCVSSETLVEILKYIGNIHNCDCWFIRDINEYIEDLERVYNINIYFDFLIGESDEQFKIIARDKAMVVS